MSEFKQPHPDLKPDNRATSPFHKADKIWNDRIGKEVMRTKNWRTIAFGAIGIALIAVLGLIYQSAKSRVEPFYVRINSDGYAQTMRPDMIKATPQLNEIIYFMANFIQNIRSIPMDVVVAKDNYSKAYSFMTKKSSSQLQQYYAQEESPALKLGKQTTNVRVISILPKSKDTYQIHWEEDSFDLEGRQKEQAKYTGLFTIIVKPPTDEKTLYVNPLGIYINEFSWAKDINK